MHVSKAIRAFALLGCFSMLAAGAAAQKLKVNPDTVLTPGGTATIEYNNPARAGQKVTITVAGGYPNPQTEKVEITLDANGVGTATWTVNSTWLAARFNGPDVQEIAIPIGE